MQTYPDTLNSAHYFLHVGMIECLIVLGKKYYTYYRYFLPIKTAYIRPSLIIGILYKCILHRSEIRATPSFSKRLSSMRSSRSSIILLLAKYHVQQLRPHKEKF